MLKEFIDKFKNHWLVDPEDVSYVRSHGASYDGVMPASTTVVMKDGTSFTLPGENAFDQAREAFIDE